ncbi:MAG: Fe(3+) ABC transporter substrate-binding protein [Acetobacteraceae bacterium]|nr:Fe(3+) ABC transporter substrate-binding protein [Acetobacteraceae bacterium]MCX7685926.1 Fe(3+) ABC transporter substrate-binding protein [Acetobacteraceae bacterium]MDW8398419.1 Fe(3+) ABC transporter substrate-binding protein [Acetobacteraceae bacterium]
MLRRSLLVLAPAALLALPAAPPAGAQERVVNIYSSRHYDTDRELYDGFTRATGIRIRLIEGDADQLIERIRNEGANSPADVLMTVDAARLHRAQAANLLQPVRNAVIEGRIPAHLRDPEGHWFGISKRARVIMFDRQNPPQGLARYEDLADPRFRGQICVRSSSHPYNLSLMGSIIAANGEQAAEAWARGVVANMARPPQGGDTPQFQAIPAGQCRLAIANTYYLARFGASQNPAERAVYERVGVIFPNQADRGAHVNVSGAGVVRTAPNREAAIAFLEYLVSDEAQRLFANGNFEYPVVAGVPPHPALAALGEFREDALNAARYGALSAQSLQIMQRAGWR